MTVAVATVKVTVVFAAVLVTLTWGAVLVQVMRGTGILLEHADFAGE